MAQLEDLSETALANRALSIVRGRGVSGISSLEDDPSYVAQVCRLHFAAVRDALLRSRSWNFAKWYVALPALADPKPAFKWAAFFALPSDCLEVLEVNENTCHDEPWEVIGRMLATNAAAPVNLTYTRRVVEPPQWDALFRELFVSSFAAALAPELAQDERIIEQTQAAAQRAMDEAAPPDSAEGTPETLSDFDFEFIRSRY